MADQIVDFKIVWNKNEDIFCEGYIIIPSNDCEDEEIEWYYYDRNGASSSQIFIEHLGVDGFKGSTEEQKQEVEKFQIDFAEDNFWITEAIMQSNEEENRTFVRKNCTVIINDGAKMECEIRELEPYTEEYAGDYIVEVIPKFNGKKINLTTYMGDMMEEFDPYDVDDGTSYIEKGHIYFEMCKNYWKDEEGKQENLDLVNEEARRIYARALTSELCIYSKYGDVMEQALDDAYDDNWLFKLSSFVDVSDEELDAFLRKEGLIDEMVE